MKNTDAMPNKIAADRETRIIQREMAAEWFKLADMFSAAEYPAE